MKGKYRVWWINTITGESGYGEPLDYSAAVDRCDAMNEEHPDVWHYALPTIAQPAPGSTLDCTAVPVAEFGYVIDAPEDDRSAG